MIKNLLRIIFLILNILIGIDLFMYLLLTPEIKVKVVTILLFFFIILNLIFIKKKIFFVKLIIIGSYIISVVLAEKIINIKEISLWYETKIKIANIEQSINSYYKLNHKLPESLENICNDKCQKDPYQKSGKLVYRVMDNNTCFIYSVGPDRFDNMGKVILGDDVIKFSRNVPPWLFMPFKSVILKISGFDKKLKGDIVKIIEVDEFFENRKIRRSLESGTSSFLNPL